jgi:hypothetical protein
MPLGSAANMLFEIKVNGPEGLSVALFEPSERGTDSEKRGTDVLFAGGFARLKRVREER